MRIISVITDHALIKLHLTLRWYQLISVECVIRSSVVHSRKATRQMVDNWLILHAIPQSIWQESGLGSPSSGPSKSSSGNTTPVRKISAHEFERGGLLKPIVTTIDGTPTFLSPTHGSDCIHVAPRVHRRSRMELRGKVCTGYAPVRYKV